jgi:predicted N-acetyltransferase YhbS
MHAVSDPVVIRPRLERDCDAVLALVRSAFSDDVRDGREEVDIVVSTWARGDGVSPIDLVAVTGTTVVGHVLGARGDLGDQGVMAVAPLGVAPTHQRQGVGTALMREFLTRADEARWPMVVLLGGPAYYQRFGFEPSGPLDITYLPVGAENPHFQVRRLTAYDASYRGPFTYCWESQLL